MGKSSASRFTSHTIPAIAMMNTPKSTLDLHVAHRNRSHGRLFSLCREFRRWVLAHDAQQRILSRLSARNIIPLLSHETR